MTAEYVRRYYGVPAKRGASGVPVTFTADTGYRVSALTRPVIDGKVVDMPLDRHEVRYLTPPLTQHH